MLFEIGFCVFAALADFGGFIAKPSAAFVDDIELHAVVDDLAVAADTLAEHYVEFRRFKRRRDLVFYDFYLRAVADRLFVLF